MSSELVPHTEWDKKAIDLAYQYAGFTDAKSLSETEKVEALQTLVPTALQVVDEARETIEHMRNELDAYRTDEIWELLERSTLSKDEMDRWWRISIFDLDNKTPDWMIHNDRVEPLLTYAKEQFQR